jgi:hypothetical protein
MDHETAIRVQAAERYLLDEFSPEERTEFEDHFFGCVECADEVRSASILAANATAVLKEENARESAAAERLLGRSRVRFFWPLLASAALNVALLVGVGLQRFGAVAPGGAAVEPQFYHSFAIPALARSGVRTETVPAGSQFFGDRFDIPPGHHFQRFEYEIRDGSNAVRSRRSLVAPAGEDSELELAIPVGSLDPGVYSLLIRGKDGANTIEISRARFLIQK